MKYIGAPGYYKKWLEPDGLMMLAAWTRDGLSYQQIAKDKIGINVSTLCAWRNKYKPIAEALSRTREMVDAEVENELFKRCHGYTATEKRAVKVKRVEYDPETGKRVREWEEILLADETVHVPADVRAQQFWLANRKNARWAFKPESPAAEEDSKETGVVMLAPVDEAVETPVQDETVNLAAQDGQDSAQVTDNG